MAGWQYATFECGDDLVELHSEDSARSAISDGRLTAETEIVIYTVSGDAQRKPAAFVGTPHSFSRFARLRTV